MNCNHPRLMEATGVGGGGGEEGWRWGKLSDNWNEIGFAKDQIFLKGCRVQWRGQVWPYFFLTLNGQSSSAGELELNRLNTWRNRDFFFAFTLKSRVSARCADVKSRTVGNEGESLPYFSATFLVETIKAWRLTALVMCFLAWLSRRELRRFLVVVK